MWQINRLSNKDVQWLIEKVSRSSFQRSITRVCYIARRDHGKRKCEMTVPKKFTFSLPAAQRRIVNEQPIAQRKDLD